MPANTEVRSMGGKSISHGLGKGKVRSVGKQISRQAPLHTSLVSTKPLSSLSAGAKKPRKWRPGTVALREIRKQQASTELIYRKASIQRATRSIVEEQASGTAFPNGARMQKAALIIIQVALEAYLTKLHEDTNLTAIHGNRVTVHAKDMQLTLRIRGERT